MIAFQNDPNNEVFFFIANMHALTTLHDATSINHNITQFLKMYLACGLDPKKTLIYTGSEVPGHAQLHRILSCISTMGMMERMHAFKDAVAKGKEGETSVGTFCYPILQAADVLLYDANLVPVGQDQKQHIEFARDIAQKFNRLFGETFVVPEPLVDKEVAVVPGIDGRKMSKSYNNYLGLLDDEKTLMKKVKLISTETKTVEEPKDPDTCNVFNILKYFISTEEEQVRRAKYTAGGMSYKDVKDFLFEKLVAFLTPIQQRFAQISDGDISSMLIEHSAKANEIAAKKMKDVYKKVGFSIDF